MHGSGKGANRHSEPLSAEDRLLATNTVPMCLPIECRLGLPQQPEKSKECSTVGSVLLFKLYWAPPEFEPR